jgi:hypothetical protein
MSLSMPIQGALSSLQGHVGRVTVSGWLGGS